MNKYTCIYQYVSSRAGGAKGQPLHVCSLTWGGLLHIQRSCTHIYAYINHIKYIYTHIFSMHKTHPSSCAPEWGDDSCRSRALHEVRCPRPSRAGCRGVGRTSDRWLARPPSPHYGGYTTRAVRSAESPSRSDCCCWIILFLKKNYWCAWCFGCGRSVWTVLHVYQKRRFRLDETLRCQIGPKCGERRRVPTTTKMHWRWSDFLSNLLCYY